MTYVKAYFVALFRLLAISLVLLGFGSLLVDIPYEAYLLLLYVDAVAAVAGPIGVWIEQRSDAKSV
ncbi:MAG TPA: hypothetical protein VIJ14_04475 [Rhabdochlamydiaceae bacterium]